MSVERDSMATSPEANSLRGLVRRMTVSRGAAVIWQLLGLKLPKKRAETIEAEVFHGVGICAIPAEGGSPEAILINVGGASAPVIIATRDEKTRAAVVPAGMKAGETCIYSAGSLVYLRNGTVEVRTPSGSARRLAFLDELVALRTYVLAHVHTGVTTGSGNTLVPAPSPPPPAAPSGTDVLRGQ